MKISLIICTYKRSAAIERLMRSVVQQIQYPDEILIIDGSPDDETKVYFETEKFKNTRYYQVAPKDRGLTKQRNFGIANVSQDIEIVSFIDDDTLLSVDYFEALQNVFKIDETIVGVGGVAVNENRWQVLEEGKFYHPKTYYTWESFVCKEGQRNVIRNYLGLSSNKPPGVMPEYSHGKTMGYPLTGKTYEVDLLIGMSMAFRKKVVDAISFSTYFEGYGLYEDADYSIRAQKLGKLVMATSVQLEHHHHPSGRPNYIKYGKMVVRNGWYVWRLKYPYPTMKSRLKWNLITLLLMFLRGLNVATTNHKKVAFEETLGRMLGYLSLINKPKHHEI